MGWVRRAAYGPQPHRCLPPRGGPIGSAVGALGDLWRCDDCGTLWQVGRACDICHAYGDPHPHGGMHAVGTDWRPAGALTQLRYWLREKREIELRGRR
jgi:hypothetical protein